MANYDKAVVGPLLRRRAHLEEVGADLAKLAELDHALRMAGYPVHEDSPLKGDERVEQEKPGVPRAEHENPPSDPPHDVRMPRDDEAKDERDAVKEKEKAEEAKAKKPGGLPGGKPDDKKTAEAKASNTDGSAKPSSDKSESDAKRVAPKERSASPKESSNASAAKSEPKPAEGKEVKHVIVDKKDEK